MVAFATGYRVPGLDPRRMPAVEALYFDDVEVAGRDDAVDSAARR